MKISTMQLKQIILEEYMKEEGISLSEDKAQELLDFIRGTGPKPDWYDREGGPPPPPDVPVPAAAETMPIPRDDAPESEYQGFQKDSGPEVEDQLTALIQGMDPETVSELFQSVFEKIPGVELSSPGDPDYPGEETLYVPGAEGRPEISLGPLREAVFKKIVEMGGTMYRGMGAAYKRDDDEWYDITAGETAPPHSTDAAEPQELVQRIERAYHDLQGAFEELPDEVSQEMGREIISRLETLMDSTEYPGDYHE
jgi:hypothetical protein